MNFLKKTNIVLSLLILFVCYFSNLGFTQDKMLALDTAVKTGKLANGFTYIIRRNTEPKNRVMFYLVNKVGSVLESDNQQGLAHFLEHMNFNGTTHYHKNELISYLEKFGVRFGADLNAYTNFDETVYELPLSTDNPELLDNGLMIMRDWAHGALLNHADIDAERGIILEEERTRAGVASRFQDQSFPSILNNAIYSRRVPIGKDSILTTFKPETIKKFYNDWYRPDLQALIVVGDINPKKIEKSIKELFSTLKNPSNERQRKNFSIPLTGKNQFLILTDKEAQTIKIQILHKFRSPELKTEADYRNNVVKNLFNSMLGARINELSQKSDLPFVQASAGSGNYLADLDVFTINVSPKPANIEAGFKMIYTEIERIKKYGFTENELDRAKVAYSSGITSMLNERNKTNSSSYIEEYVNYFLKGEASPGIQAEYEMTMADLKSITLKDITSLLLSYTKPIDREILITAPEQNKNSLPDEQKIAEWMQQVTAGPLSPYIESKLDTTLMPVISAPGKVVSKSEDDKIGITEFAFSNGVKIILKPTSFKNDQIIFNAFKPGGTSLSSDKDYLSASVAASIVSQGGLGQFNNIALQKILDGKKVGVSPFINDLYEGLQGTMGTADAETAFQLIHLYFTSPRKDTIEFNNMISRIKASLANRKNNPEAVYADTVNAVLSGYNYRSITPTESEISLIDFNKSFEFYKKLFSNAAGFTFVFTGNIDETKFLTLCKTYIGSLPSSNDKITFRDLDIQTPDGLISKTVYSGSQSKATVQLVYHGTYDFSMDNNIKLDALAQIVELRLLDRLRESEGGVYTPRVSTSFGKLPRSRYSISVYFDCDPKNVEKLIAATYEEINNLKRDGISADDLTKYKAAAIKSFEVQLGSNEYWLGYLAGQIRNDESFEQLLTYKDMVYKLDSKSLQEAAQVFLKGSDLVRLVLMPINVK